MQEVDTVDNMKGLGQYIYIHVIFAKDGGKADAEPIFKFNNGHFGGSIEVLFDDCSGSMEEVFTRFVQPAIERALER